MAGTCLKTRERGAAIFFAGISFCLSACLGPSSGPAATEGARDQEDNSDCPLGARGCACTDGGVCDDGLWCNEGKCEEAPNADESGGGSRTKDRDPESPSPSDSAETESSEGGEDDWEGESGSESGDLPEEDPRPPLLNVLTPLEQQWFLSNGLTNNIRIDFRVVPPRVHCNGELAESRATEGTAMVTDPKTGELLLYAAGRTFEDPEKGAEEGISVFSGQSHLPLPIAGVAPDGVSANEAWIRGRLDLAEPVMFAPKPGGRRSEFLMFTIELSNSTTGQGDIYYHEIDLAKGELGTVTSTNNLFAIGQVGGAMDILPHANGEDFWVALFNSSNRVRLFPVTKDEVPGTEITSTLSLYGGAVRFGSISHNLDYTKLAAAVGPDGSGYGAAMVVDFDAEEGFLSGGDSQHGNIESGVVGYQPCLSPDGEKMYFTRGNEGTHGQFGTPYQAYLGGALPKQVRLSDETGFGGCKMGPDGKIYWTRANSDALSIVHSPNEREEESNFEVDALDLNGCTSGFALPNQTGSYLNYLEE